MSSTSVTVWTCSDCGATVTLGPLQWSGFEDVNVQILKCPNPVCTGTMTTSDPRDEAA